MVRIVAIDYGLRRVGIAITDTTGTIPLPFKTIPPECLFSFLKMYLKKENVTTIVLGNPRGVEEGKDIVLATKKVYGELCEIFPEKNVVFIDERYSSRVASFYIHEYFNKRERKKKENIDTMSAVVILSSYLNLLNKKENL